MPWYKTGTVSVVQNSNAVIGTGTTFISSGRVGDGFRGPDGRWYEVTNIASDTAMSIDPPYQGDTEPNGLYAVAPLQGYVKDTADALREASSQVAGALDGLDESVAEAMDAAAEAVQSKNAAATSATTAGQAADAALQSKNAAATSATNAGQSATDALSSKNAAATSATNASQSADAALQSKNAAATSATNAASSAAAAAELGVGKGFIEGLKMVWLGLTSIQVVPGSCYMPSLNRVYKVPNALTVTPPAGVTGFAHIYLYDNAGAPALEMVTTEPAAYWNGARTKTGDTTRRYIGSVLLASGAAYNFRHYPDLSRVTYLYGTPSAAPFSLLSGGTSTSAALVAAANACPSSATHIDLLVSAGGAGSVFMGNEDQANALSSSNWLFVFISTGYASIDMPLGLNNGLRRFQYLVSGSASAFIVSKGYIFER